MKKILTFIVNENKKILLLHNNYEDLSHGGDIWYTVTGAYEKCDKNMEDTVIREVMEETNLNVIESKYLNVLCNYKKNTNDCREYFYISFVKNGNIRLNEEWTDYKWLTLNEFINKCHFYYNKEVLYNILNKGIDKELYYKEEIELN